MAQIANSRNVEACVLRISPRAALTMAGEFAIASIASYEFKKHNFHIEKLRLWELPFLARTYTHSHDTISNIAGCR
jgi:hypothetical protein